ncbi:MAG: phosphoribosylformylglycinamidine synthase subunit PurS [Actinomycetota bacterium]|jgi:phosphoribosylformylglycinamidine synthase|nr:phosphoribosylformylglycinamidine synthase subunit PurS [Actinomycetota bacterium]
MSFIANVNVMLKEGIADPQGQTIERALPALGFSGVGDVRVGKRIRLAVDAADENEARERVEQMCERLLSNPVIESFEVTLES